MIKGISSLPVILLLGGIIVTFAIGATLLIFLLNNANLGERMAAEALTAGRSGIEDGILRVIRNKNYQGDYSLIVNNRTVDVKICKDTCDPIGKHIITAINAAAINRRQIKAILEVNAITGEVLIESIKEMPL